MSAAGGGHRVAPVTASSERDDRPVVGPGGLLWLPI